MKKKQKTVSHSKQDIFKTSPFNALKGIVVEKPTEKPVEPVAIPAARPAPPEDDTTLFIQAMQDVKRVHTQEKPQPAATKAGQVTTDIAKKTEIVPKAVHAIPQSEQDTFIKAIKQLRLDISFEDRLPEEEELRPLGGNRLKQLKKGVISVERQIDLHGLTRVEALEALPIFFESAARHGEKAVLIITGKGTNSPGEPVIQQAVAAWLKDAGRQYAAEFAPAPREMGGSGAFVVFLKNSSKSSK